MAKTMLLFIFLAFIMSIQACAVKTYVSPEGAKLTSTTFLWGPEVTGLKATDGNRTLTIDSQKSDIQSALTAINTLAGAVK